MGCCNSNLEPANNTNTVLRIDTPQDEEVLIKKAENLLPFANRSSKEIVPLIIAKGKVGVLSMIRLRRIAINLDLDPTVFSNNKTLLNSQVFQILKSDKNQLDILDLALFAVLVGEDSSLEKASLIFNIFKNKESELLTKETFTEALEKAIEISSEKIPQMALLYNQITQKELDSYKETLLENKTKYINSVVVKVFKGKINLDQEKFLKNLNDSSLLGEITWPSEIRAALSSAPQFVQTV